MLNRIVPEIAGFYWILDITVRDMICDAYHTQRAHLTHRLWINQLSHLYGSDCSIQNSHADNIPVQAVHSQDDLQHNSALPGASRLARFARGPQAAYELKIPELRTPKHDRRALAICESVKSPPCADPRKPGRVSTMFTSKLGYMSFVSAFTAACRRAMIS